MANRFWLSAILCGVSLSTQACTKTEDEESLKQEIRRSEEHYKQEAGADSKADEEAEEALSKETKQRPLHKNTVTLPALEKAVAENLTASWEIKSVKTVNGALTIRTNIRRITDIIYYAMLPGVCSHKCFMDTLRRSSFAPPPAASNGRHMVYFRSGDYNAYAVSAKPRRSKHESKK